MIKHVLITSAVVLVIVAVAARSKTLVGLMNIQPASTPPLP
jgi:hypothetical protein